MGKRPGSLEGLGVEVNFWNGRKVLVTGHTGFKGSWLCWWLLRHGAEVHGLALPPTSTQSLFQVLELEGKLASSHFVDVRDLEPLKEVATAVNPEIVFHLAAQPLVRYSYQNPVETYQVNVMGTVHLLEALRSTPATRVVVNVTTDKCYENQEWPWPYRETDRLGGHDPYSNSKACSEQVTAAYRSSFFSKEGVRVATARAGNVIGGGDWAQDRLLPDFLRAIDAGNEVVIRSPHAVRPWQHVLEPLSGYLALAERLWQEPELTLMEWNFGPSETSARSVEWIVKFLCSRLKDARYRVEREHLQPHEAGTLRLDSSRAHHLLHWAARWDLGEALERTITWHLEWRRGGDMQAMTSLQIAAYEGMIKSE